MPKGPRLCETAAMPLIDVTHDESVGEETLRRLAEVLPDLVSEAVECPEEPWTGRLGPGDIEIRFRKKSVLDVGDLDVVVERSAAAIPFRKGPLKNNFPDPPQGQRLPGNTDYPTGIKANDHGMQ